MFVGDNQTFCKYGCIGHVDTGAIVVATSETLAKKLIKAVDPNDYGQYVEGKYFVSV